MASAESPGGGLRRLDLLATVGDVAKNLDLQLSDAATYGAAEIDLVGHRQRVAVSVQAGRAWTNNGALVAVLGAACFPGIDWLVAAVPERYKGTVTARRIQRDISALAASANGVRLDLKGVLILSF